MQRFALGSLAFVTAACTGADARSALNEPVIDTLAGGVVQVTNTGPTVWADTSGWRIVEEMVIAPPEGSPGELSGTNGLAADEAGNVYVMQREPTRIAVFGPDGNYLRDIGREGDGPGEFRNGMLGIVGDTLFVQDPNNTRLTTFKTDGSFIAASPSQCCWFTSRLPVLADGRVMIMGPPPAGANDEARGAYFLTRMDGVVTDTIMMPADRPDETGDYWEVVRRSGQNTSISRINIPMKANDQAEVRPDGKVVRGRNDSYRLVIGTDFTDSVRVIVASAPTLTVSDIQRDSAYKATLDEQRDDWRDAFAEVAKLSDIPNTWPVWSSMAIDRDNNIWVSLPGERGPHSMFQVFNADGVLLGNVPAVGGGSILNGFWTRDRVYVGDEDENGLPVIRVYRIVKSPAGN